MKVSRTCRSDGARFHLSRGVVALGFFWVASGAVGPSRAQSLPPSTSADQPHSVEQNASPVQGATPPQEGSLLRAPAKSEGELRVERSVAAGGGFLGFGVTVTPGAVKLIRCEAPCQRGEVTSSIELPEELAKAKKTFVEVRSKNGARALLVRWSAPQKTYVLVVMGQREGEERGSEPRLLLKGFVGPDSPQKSDLVVDKFDGGERLLMASSPQDALCGRKVASVTRVLEPDDGKLRTVRLPAVSIQDREGAKAISAEPLEAASQGTLDGRVLIPVVSKQSEGAVIAADLDRLVPWQSGYDFLEFSLPEGAEKNTIVLQLSSAPKEAKELFLATTDALYRIDVPPSDGTLVAVRVPADAQAGCMALVQPQRAVPIVEVMALAPWSSPSATADLVARLEESDAGVAEAALGLRGEEAGKALARVLSAQSPLARGRGLEIARVLPGDAGVPVFVAVLEFGSRDQQQEAIEFLRPHTKRVTSLIQERLAVASPAGRTRLVDALVTLNPNVAAAHLVPLFSGASSAERLRLRRSLARLAASGRHDDSLRQLLEELRHDSSKTSDDVSIEVVRALGPQLLGWRDIAVPLTLGLSQRANFSRAYRLLPHVNDLRKTAPKLEEVFQSWLAGKAPKGLSDTERAALTTSALSFLAEAEEKDASTPFARELRAALGSENVRVRRAALGVYARTDMSVPSELGRDLLTDDDWPEVRAEAARALIARKDDDGAIERLLLRRLTADDEPVVRAAIAEALAQRPSEASGKALRRAFERDADPRVRAEAAISLGKMCDEASLEALTAAARRLGQGAVDDAAVTVGLAAVTALAQLNPPDLKKRVAPIFQKGVSRVVVNQVEQRLLVAKERSSCSGDAAR